MLAKRKMKVIAMRVVVLYLRLLGVYTPPSVPLFRVYCWIGPFRLSAALNRKLRLVARGTLFCISFVRRMLLSNVSFQYLRQPCSLGVP